MDATPLWQKLQQAAGQPDQGRTGLWVWLQTKLDPALYRPEAAPGVVISALQDREGRYYVIKNPAAKTYYRLSDRDHFLWALMDGTRTIKDLVVAYFHQYGAFAFARVAGLVAGLRASLFLADRPAEVYRRVREGLEGRHLRTRLGRLWHAFLQKPIAINGLDAWLGRWYRRVGWLLFTIPAQFLYAFLSLLGLILFGSLFLSGRYSLVSEAGSYGVGLALLIAAQFVAVFLHELAHALTVKHYGREVRRAGVMIYFGMPAFFVDTTDLWLEGRRGRLAVSWAGPYSGLILAGLVTAIIALWPALPLNSLLFKFAFTCYILAFINLNPLLELDGYYMLMDWLQIPNLRRKSLEFLRLGLPARWRSLRSRAAPGPSDGPALSLASGGAFGLLRLARSLSSEERIFVAFGLLAAAWTVYAIYTGLMFWQTRLAASVRSLWEGGGGVGQLALGLLGVAISAVFVALIGATPYRLIRGWLAAAAQRGLFRSAWRIAGLLVAGSLLLAVLPEALGYGWVAQLVGMAGLVAAAGLAWQNGRGYAGSRLATGFYAWAAAAFALLLAGIFASAAGVGVARPGAWRALSLACAALGGAALLLGSALLFRYISFAPAWLLMAVAVVGMAIAALTGLPPAFPYLLLTAGLYLHRSSIARSTVSAARPAMAPGLSDAQRLQRVFVWMTTAIQSQLAQIAGQRGAAAVARQFNDYALTTGWRVSLAREQLSIQDGTPDEWPLIQRGEVYAAALSLLLDLAAKEMGEPLTVAALRRAFDALPWEEREIGAQYLFRAMPRAAALGAAFDAMARDYAWLLRGMPLFATISGDEIAALARCLTPRRCRAGEVIIRQGERGDRFYIVRQGHVTVSQRDERGISKVVNQWERGGYFGEIALLRDVPRTATCTAAVPTELLCLSRTDFDRLVRDRFALRDKLDRSVARAELLRRIPLFAEMEGAHIQRLAAEMRDETYPPESYLIRQGEIGETFYVIQSGWVEILTERDGVAKPIAKRGPGEYVGEIALLLSVPRTASVRAQTQTEALALDNAGFERLVAQHFLAGQGLQLETSRRMMSLREAL